MKRKFLITFAVGTIAGGRAFATGSAAADETNKLHLDTSLDLFLAGMSGEVTAKGVPAHVDASFKNIFNHLEAGAAGRFTLGYERWFLCTEVSYLRLSPQCPWQTWNFTQWLVEPSVGYEVCKYFRAFAGRRGKGKVSTGSNHLGFRCVKSPTQANLSANE